MPIKIIENLIPESFPYFPVLKSGKINKTITKHFTNLHLYLDRDRLALLTWLIYECAADNTFKYSHILVERYSAAISAAEKQYRAKSNLNISVKKIRDAFSGLIIGGYILPTFDKSIFLLNPMLSYRPEYLNKREYRNVVFEYANVKHVKSFCKGYMTTINNKIKAKNGGKII